MLYTVLLLTGHVRFLPVVGVSSLPGLTWKLDPSCLILQLKAMLPYNKVGSEGDGYDVKGISSLCRSTLNLTLGCYGICWCSHNLVNLYGPLEAL